MTPPPSSSARTEAKPLDEYRRKRHPDRTPEPVPKGPGSRRAPKSKGKPIFVIQEHHASSLHWDFRLEHDGVLPSWALPKGLPLDPSQNRLAVATEDHPLDYANFEGEIPAGEYGGGSVSIWDSGPYDVEKWSDREVAVVLHGERANGRYVLFQTKDNQWMIHRRDPVPDGWAPLPTHFRPMLATPGELPKGRGWAYEFKWDGVRAGVGVEGGRIQVRSRNDLDLTAAFPELRGLGESLGMTTAFLDGEIVVLDADGAPRFGLIQHRMHVDSPRVAARLAKETPASLMVFDLLYLNGLSLLELPYRDRREVLESLDIGGDHWAVSPSFTGHGSEVMRTAQQNGLEGVVAKRATSPYRPGRRSDEWIKTKFVRTQEVVVGGYTPGNGARRDTFGALLLGIPGNDGLTYVGKVGTGFSSSERAELIERLRRVERKTSPFAAPPPLPRSAGTVWVRPTVVGEVQFGEWTSEGHLRHPSWRGLRPDKSPKEVVRES
ncbi:MAG TPA: non-homologous end-joining DNA ligase [Acidimicrobiales bacterium]|nr:non-homologous end-joining DNA ligase [Acidimicrobiales bacterium]